MTTELRMLNAEPPKGIGGGFVAAVDKDGGYIQITNANTGILLTPDQACALRDWLVAAMKEWRP